MTHNIKIRKEYADAVHDGTKTFEVRLNDRGYQTGDHVVFHVIDRETGAELSDHGLHLKEYEITYVLSTYGVMDCYVVFSIKPMEDV